MYELMLYRTKKELIRVHWIDEEIFKEWERDGDVIKVCDQDRNVLWWCTSEDSILLSMAITYGERFVRGSDWYESVGE